MDRLIDEKKHISKLKNLLAALEFGINHEMISKEGINEIYGLLTNYRRWIHFNNKDDIDCGCK